jgi:hypothetical protein
MLRQGKGVIQMNFGGVVFRQSLLKGTIKGVNMSMSTSSPSLAAHITNKRLCLSRVLFAHPRPFIIQVQLPPILPYKHAI